ncbi:MAG TPA: HIT domain-containing protein [Spirochaetia bacterium]|nr:HIT domain-containing protein [Spirochaetales bacterium]HRY72919.1 HIT domain-containing protein [Spirochaetia bacterium]
MEYFFNFDKISYLKGKRPDGCILCLIRDGSAEVERLVAAETASFVVSVNLYPYNPGHLILFPKRHVVDIRELSPGERLELDRLVDRCLAALDESHGPAGYNIGYNMGLVAGASIDHLHLHIIPRYPREIGISELIAGARVLVEDPRNTLVRFKEAFKA